jgi:hypothetical protein
VHRAIPLASALLFVETMTCWYTKAMSGGATASPVAAAAKIDPDKPVWVAPVAPVKLEVPLSKSPHPEWDRLASFDGVACREKLVSLGVQFRALPDAPAPDAHGCGIPHGVLVTRGPTGIAYSPPLQIDCSLALELPAIEAAVQEQAGQYLSTSIRGINTFGTYSCRDVRGGFTGRLSEHAVGDAIDLGAFIPRRGAVVSVARDYRPFQDAPGAAGLFLRGVFRALRADSGLTYVIGPETRADHHDHIHVDRAEPWWGRSAAWSG